MFYFMFYYLIGALIYGCHTSILVINVITKNKLCKHITENEKEGLFCTYLSRIIFQSIIMVVFPILFAIYIYLNTHYSENLFITSGLFTVVWLYITGMIVKLIYSLITKSVKIIKDYDYELYFQNKDLFWSICPLLYGVLFSLYDFKIFFTIFAIVLGKYIWLDTFKKESKTTMRMKLKVLRDNYKIDLILLFAQSMILGYFLIRWFPVRNSSIESTYQHQTFLIAICFLMPTLDVIIFNSIRSSFFTIKSNKNKSNNK